MKKDYEKHLLTLDYRGREYKRVILRKLVAGAIEKCALIAETAYPSATDEERLYGQFLANEIRKWWTARD